ncbi:hypothetical protein [Halorubellus litoreus]
MLGDDDSDPLANRRRDRRLFAALVAAAMTSFLTLDLLGHHVVAVATYWTLSVVAFAVLYRSDVVVDERDVALEQLASHHTILAVVAALVVLGPGLSALADAGIYDAPPLVDGALLGWVAVLAAWGLAYGVTRLRR